jgi:ornithine carbamoyltransferase
MNLRPGSGTKRAHPRRRRFLQQAHRPLRLSDCVGELLFERTVHLQVGAIVERVAGEAPRFALKGGIGWPVAAVEHVPSQDDELATAHHYYLLMTQARHFITGEELTREELERLIDRAADLKRAGTVNGDRPLHGRTLALLFDRPSTRTRVSFEVAVVQLGGDALVLTSNELQLARGEPVRDTAMVLSRYLDALIARLGEQEVLVELGRYADVPVINALTPLHHPCQALADLLTLKERFGELEGLRLAYVGDGNNVCHSLMLLGARTGVEVAVATPRALTPDPEIVRAAGGSVQLTDDPRAAAEGAHALYTDVWVSMGDEDESRSRRELLAGYQVNAELLARARDDAVVLHCLPAHTGEEITEDLLYGERSAVWDQAENRLHAQKALLEFLLA